MEENKPQEITIPRRKLSIRMQLYKKYRLQGLSGYRAAIKAGYSKATAWNAHKNIERRCNFDQILIEAGMDDVSLSQLIAEGLQAKKPVACDVFIRNENGDLKVNKNSNDWIEYEDWNARHKFLETVLTLQGKLRIKFEHSGRIDGEQIRINIIHTNANIPDREKREGSETVDLIGQARASFSEQK